IFRRRIKQRRGYLASPLSLGNLPAFFSASCISHSNCPLVLRNSSAAHFSTAFINFSSILRAKGFLFAIIHLSSLICLIIDGFLCFLTVLRTDQKLFAIFLFDHYSLISFHVISPAVPTKPDAPATISPVRIADNLYRLDVIERDFFPGIDDGRIA